MENSSTIKSRILQFIDYKGINKSKLYRLTGIANGTLDKKGGISAESVVKFFSTFPELNLEWLLIGEGTMLKSSVKMEQSPPGSNVTECAHCGDRRKLIDALEKTVRAQEESLEFYRDQELKRAGRSAS